MVLLHWKIYLLILMLISTNSENLSERSTKYMQAFNEIFPHVDMKSQKVYEFVEDETNLKKVILLNTQRCVKERQNLHRVTRSVYNLMALPLDLMYATTVATTYCNSDDADRYGYIDQ